MAFDGRILSGVSVLAAVVEGGSFVKAAELIGITDSGVSRAIGRLETRLGVRLLDRTTRSVSLTDEGRRFYEEVKPHLNAIEDAATVASGAVSAVRGRLKVDIDPFFLPLVLAGRLGAFCERYPELAIEFVSSEQCRRSGVRGHRSCHPLRTAAPLDPCFAQADRSADPDRRIAAAISSATAGPDHPSDLAAASLSAVSRSATAAGRSTGSSSATSETIEVPTSGPLTFTDPKSMLEECVAGTGIAQVIGWGVGEFARQRRPGRPFSGLARRALPALRLPSIAQASAGQGARLRRFLRRGDPAAVALAVGLLRAEGD